MNGRAGRMAGWAACVLWLALPAAAQDGAGPQFGMPWLARVNYVVDGDSIWVRPDGGGARVRLRIDGVDAPEICQTLAPNLARHYSSWR